MNQQQVGITILVIDYIFPLFVYFVKAREDAFIVKLSSSMSA
jgi:hypothetical protein